MPTCFRTLEATCRVCLDLVWTYSVLANVHGLKHGTIERLRDKMIILEQIELNVNVCHCCYLTKACSLNLLNTHFATVYNSL